MGRAEGGEAGGHTLAHPVRCAGRATRRSTCLPVEADAVAPCSTQTGAARSAEAERAGSVAGWYGEQRARSSAMEVARPRCLEGRAVWRRVSRRVVAVGERSAKKRQGVARVATQSTDTGVSCQFPFPRGRSVTIPRRFRAATPIVEPGWTPAYSHIPVFGRRNPGMWAGKSRPGPSHFPGTRPENGRGAPKGARVRAGPSRAGYGCRRPAAGGPVRRGIPRCCGRCAGGRQWPCRPCPGEKA